MDRNELRKRLTTGDLGKCPECGERAGVVRSAKRSYHVECLSCGFTTEEKMTQIGAVREWTRYFDRFRGGGWNRKVTFSPCCGSPPEITGENLVNPYRWLSSQTVIVRCRKCGNEARANCLKRIEWTPR